MQIIEIKNNLVRISYNSSQDNLVLSGFVVIKDENISFIAQVMHLEANLKGSYAIVKLIFTFDDSGVITNYNGAIPNPNCAVGLVDAEELLGVMPAETPVFWGILAQQNLELNLDIKLFEENLLVCSEYAENNNIFVKNVASQLVFKGKKVLILDYQGGISEKKLILGDNFKLPLNYDTIDFIYERGLDDASGESKALIQEIFLEVQNYVKTIPERFIPFDLFKSVVDEQYDSLGLVELVLLKNKLIKFQEAGIFAQEKSDFAALETSLAENALTVLDVSKVGAKIQREAVSYVYSLLSGADNEVFVIANVDDETSDKKLLKQIFMTKNVHSVLICPYSYKYLNELKKLSKNFIFFSPIQQQQDFASYNAFLNKLNPDEYIVYGKATHNIPFIVKLDEAPQRYNKSQQVEEILTESEAIQPETAGIEPVSVGTGYDEPSMQVDTALEQPLDFDDEQSSVEDFLDVPLVPLEEEFIAEVEASEQTTQELLDEQIKQDVETLYTVPQEELNQVESEHLTEDDLDFIEALNADSDFDEEFFAETVEDEQDEFAEDVIVDDAQSQFQAQPELEDDELAEQLLSLPDEDETLKELQPEDVLEPTAEEDVVLDILPVSESKNSIPIYSAQIPSKEGAEASDFAQGDEVTHVKYGKGVIEKMITYGNKTLCSIQFDNVGRRLLDPTLAELTKV